MSASEKVALITGAGSGIGAATSIYFAGKGWRLVLNDLRLDRLEDVAKSCKEACRHENEIILLPGDVRDTSVVKASVNKTITTFSRLDLLVNCAGVVRMGSGLTAPYDDYDFMIDTNLKAVILWCREAAPYLVKTKELGPQGVRVNSVSPGPIETNLLTSLFTSEEYLKKIERWIEMTPLGKIGLTEDVVNAIAFLVSDNARFITGSNLYVDGGIVNAIEKKAIDRQGKMPGSMD